jgi:hypothetical protein
MRRKSLWVGGVLACFAAVVAIVGYINLNALIPVAAMGVN